MMDKLSVADVLDRAAEVLSRPGAWTRGGYFRSRELQTSVDRDRADCFCVVGAMTISAGRKAYPAQIEGGDVGKAFIAALPPGAIEGTGGEYGIFVWNDAPERTQAEVVATLREAASLARSPVSDNGEG
jgi:hypothetical protein